MDTYKSRQGAAIRTKEIAASLYISEAAVKKHVNAILLKYGVKNRTQLANAVIGSAGQPR